MGCHILLWQSSVNLNVSGQLQALVGGVRVCLQVLALYLLLRWWTLHSWSHRIYSTVFLKPVIVYSSQKDEPNRVTHCASSTGGKEKEVVCVCVFVYSCFTCVYICILLNNEINFLIWLWDTTSTSQYNSLVCCHAWYHVCPLEVHSCETA